MYQSGAFVELLEIRRTDGTIHRLANNNEDIVWNSYTWDKFSFEGGEYEEDSGGSVPSLQVRVCNIGGDMESAILSTSNQMLGDEVFYYLIHTDELTLTTPALSAQFEILEAPCDDEWVYFKLGLENLFLRRFPLNVYRRNIGRYQPTMTHVCSYANSASCDRKFATCITLGKSTIYCGQPAIPGGAWKAA